ncbi:MAG: Ig-like domain-containing protein [Acidobacteriia bacterium]|nr:Ig-like domain-containing protein [Terriglobia bacterium]
MNKGTLALAGALALLGPFLVSAATITVNSTNDNLTAANGQCTLREALRNANTNSDTTGGDCTAGTGADTIVLPAGTYTLALPGAGEDGGLTGDLDVLDPLTITGAGSGSTIIDGGALDRVFDVAPNAVTFAMSISGVTIRNGSVAGFGGGVFVDPFSSATLTLTDCVISGNTATGFNGGGIAMSAASTLNLTRVTFQTNTSGFNGGGVSCFGCTATVNACVFSGNHSTGGALGGAGFFNGGGTVTITGGTIGANVSNSPGGGLTNAGFGAASVQNAELTTNSTTGDGGAILNDPSIGASSSFTLATSRVYGNTATGATGFGSTGGTLTLANNWWGCNAGPQLPPGGNGCDTVANVAAATPWLVLQGSAVPSSVQIGGSSAVTADVTHNSASAHIVSGFIPDGTPLSFLGTLGTAAPSPNTTTNGVTGTVFTAGLIGGAGAVAITLDGQTISVPIAVLGPATITATAGTPQSTPIGSPFPADLEATVRDSLSNPIAGVTVTFTAPASGPSGTFPAGNTATTDALGRASVPFVANMIIGSYQVTANVSPPLASPAVFDLDNKELPIPALGPLGLAALALLIAGIGAALVTARRIAS